MFAQPSVALGGSIGGGAFNGPAVSEVGVPFAPTKPLRISNAGGNTSGLAPLRRPFYHNTVKEQYNQSESLNWPMLYQASEFELQICRLPVC